MATQFKIEDEYSIVSQQKNKMKEVRIGLPRTIYDYDGLKMNSFGFYYLSFFNDTLIDNVVEREFKSSWEYKPQYVADEIFNDPRLYHLILFVNNISSIDYFNIKTIGFKLKIPRVDVVNFITREIRRMNINEKEEEVLNDRYGETENF